MGEVVNFAPDPTAQLLTDNEFVSDMCRYSEGLLTEKFIRRKYGKLNEDAWNRLGENEELVSAIENEKLRRCRNGDSAREKAQKLYVSAPDVLGNILHGETVNPRFKIESAKELRAIAANGPQAVPAADRFQIIINLGDVSERYDKPIAISPNDGPNIDTTTLTVTAAKQNKDDGGGEPL
jgi:hypothetical protein